MNPKKLKALGRKVELAMRYRQILEERKKEIEFARELMPFELKVFNESVRLIDAGRDRLMIELRREGPSGVYRDVFFIQRLPGGKALFLSSEMREGCIADLNERKCETYIRLPPKSFFEFFE